ncbi:MAG: hypothetical protein ACRD0K_07060 [Egibacteraceae bacterium]
MKLNAVTAAAFLILTVLVLGAVAWVGLAGSSPRTTSVVATEDVARDTVAPSAPQPPPSDPAPSQLRSAVTAPPLPEPEPAAPVSPSPSSPGRIRGLHVLCPTEEGGFAHLLLTADTYYKAVTPEEEARLTTLLGPPVTNVDPALLPPMSAMSVTDALELTALSSPSN